MSATPEVAAAQARLDAIPADLVSQALRLAVMRAAEAASVHRDASQALDQAVRGAQAALEAGDVSGAAQAAAMIVACERLRAMLPSTEVDPGPVADALDHAAAVVRQSAAALPQIPTVSYTAEYAAWISLPPEWRNASTPPAALASDLQAQQAVDELQRSRESVLATIAAFPKTLTSPGDPVGLLQTASDVRGMCARHAVESAPVLAQVHEANTTRRLAGLTWLPPTGISTPALAALAAR